MQDENKSEDQRQRIVGGFNTFVIDDVPREGMVVGRGVVLLTLEPQDAERLADGG